MPSAHVRRFLHVNYNCRDLDALERFYVGVFGLKPVMRTQEEGGDGTPFGIYGESVRSRTTFLYDHRGGKWSNSLEMVEWHNPATVGEVYPEPWCRGLQSAAYSAPDLDAAAEAAAETGGSVERRSDGWLLLRDPEGVWVEVYEKEGPSQAMFLRYVCSDLDRTLAWWGDLGFTKADLAPVAGDAVWPGAGDRSITAEQGMVGTDDPTFGLVFTTWSGPEPTGPTYAMPYHEGLYRMALAVDDVTTAHAALESVGVTRQVPYKFDLPGTKLTDGLKIMFIRDPDLVLVELVERPRVGPNPT